ncbi:SulP family inorganic anion transporter [Sediminicola luteus]|uniref:Sodium-independent anion transporter n=1 Tax=Sediminicola luteus TaxID=319238 RepID=A0A2A4G910_9FLAO|nr:sulfate permease [Sediminicola luteus]PCE64468.1 sodium-independent anion transporter [Sediminicola luteus]
MKRFFPITEWLPTYPKKWLGQDALGGLTVGVLLVPQGMAYAMVAGLPPVYGLYAALLPVLIYAFLGTSRQLGVGPVAMDSLLVAAGLGVMSISSIEAYLSLVVLLCFLVGAIQMILGVFRLGFLVNFLSRPVISGFTTAAGLIIISSQVKHLLGLPVLGGNQLHTIWGHIFPKLSQLTLWDLVLGIGAILILLAFKKWLPKVPAHLIVVVMGILAVTLGGLEAYGVHVVGEVPKGLPGFNMPNFEWAVISDLLPIALTLAFVGCLEAISIGKALEEKSGEETVRPNQEFIALGSANMLGSFFQAYPVTGSFSRSAISYDAGARTPLASVVAVVLVALTLLFLTPLFYNLPNAVLAAIIMVSVYGLLDIDYAFTLWKQHKDESLVWLLTCGFTLFVGIPEGILAGVVVSLILMVYRSSRPHIAQLAQIRGTDYFRNVDRFKDAVAPREGLLILRLDAQLYYANVGYFKKAVQEKLETNPQTETLILNAEAINYIDATGAKALGKLIEQLSEKEITLYISGAIGPTRDVLFSSGLIDQLGSDHLFARLLDAVTYYEGSTERSVMAKKVAFQNRGKR